MPTPRSRNPASVQEECARLETLCDHEILDTKPEPFFDGITQLAAQICGTPVALISLVDEHRLWFKARVGVRKSEMPRKDSLCSDAICGEDLFTIGDLRRHERWRRSAAVAGPPHLRFYAGAPLRLSNGHVLGTLCVIDYRPRRLSTSQCDAMRLLARQVVSQFELQHSIAALKRTAEAREQAEGALRRSEERFQQFMDNGPANAYIKDDEGRFIYVNEQLTRRFERPAADWLGKTDADIVGSVPASGVVEHDLQVLNEDRPITVEEVVPTPDGQTRYWLSYKFPVRDGDRKQVGGLSLDITGRKNAEHERERLVSDLQQALAQVKTLSGFLPICASCKNVRRDEGYWQQIESYLSEHSEVEFTHGICPACIQKLYPEFAAQQRAQPPRPLAADDGPG